MNFKLLFFLIGFSILGIGIFVFFAQMGSSENQIEDPADNLSAVWNMPIAIRKGRIDSYRLPAMELRDFLFPNSSKPPILEIDYVGKIPNNVFFIDRWYPRNSQNGYIILIQDVGARLIASNFEEEKKAIERLKTLAEVTENGVVLPKNRLVTNYLAMNDFKITDGIYYTDVPGGMVACPYNQRDSLQEVINSATNTLGYLDVVHSANYNPMCGGFMWIELINAEANTQGYMVAIQDGGILIHSTNIDEAINAMNTLQSIMIRHNNSNFLPSNLIISSFPILHDN